MLQSKSPYFSGMQTNSISKQGKSRRGRNFTFIYSNSENYQQDNLELRMKAQELQIYVNSLETKIEKLENFANIANCTTRHNQHTRISNNIEDMYSAYSSLSKKVIKIKDNESKAFDNYINMCQDKEKSIVDTKLDYSNKKTKIKLLKEALSKCSKEYDISLLKLEKIVFSFVII